MVTEIISKRSVGKTTLMIDVIANDLNFGTVFVAQTNDNIQPIIKKLKAKGIEVTYQRCTVKNKFTGYLLTKKV